MNNLEFFRNVSIGLYVDTGSIVHRLTPATKYLGAFTLFAALFSNATVPGTTAVCAVAFGIGVAARLKPGSLVRGALPAWPFLAVMVALTFVFQSPLDSSASLIVLGPIRVTVAELVAVALLVTRFIAVVVVLGLLTSVMTEREAAYGIEDVLLPLARLGVPAREVALVVACALRFVPIIAGELEAIVKAQASRGGDFGGRRTGPIRAARTYLPLFVPLVVRALERAELLVEAMEARCYSGGARTRLASFGPVRGEKLLRCAILVVGASGVTIGLLIR